MATNHREQLKAIRTFPSLVKYLRDELDWPITTDDFDDATFDYTPEELGIDSVNAAKIQEIKRLRPLTSTQPWGIFFVKFEPKRLPVVALRRILSRVAVKKRASANSAERAAWETDDLMFISSYGEGDQRQISFAHFSQDGQRGGLPTLKVLGWDNLDTPLHLDHIADVLHEQLLWPDEPEDADGWREGWRSAFTLRHREVIATSQTLAIRLAALARAIRDRIRTVLEVETDEGQITKLMEEFREALVHDLDEDDFADMYAQTISYGLLTARITDPDGKGSDPHLPVTSPFLKELMESFLGEGRAKVGASVGGGIDFDELGIQEVADLLDSANMEAVVRDFGDRNPQEDPVIHFYELFLKEYDAAKRMQRGVFYTPGPVVSYIVRSVDALLRSEFGLEDGLADTATWAEVVQKRHGLDIPQGASPEQQFVQILDPACGTGTFLVETISVIHETMLTKWNMEGHGERQIDTLWNEYVAHHLLPRLHGYELLMAPYAIAHLKVGLKLYETGYRFGSSERARIYLTNALEPAADAQLTLGFLPALAHEAQAVNEIKREQHFTVVLGNPPYSLQSANLELHHRALVEQYKFVDGERIYERAALQLEKNLNDDYVKFIRLADLSVAQSGVGLIGLITNHSYLDNPTMRGLRWNLMDTTSQLWVIDLHGNSTKRERPPAGGEDQNVFEIKQGVAIMLGVRVAEPSPSPCKVHHHELWGDRVHKESWLGANNVLGHLWKRLAPSSDAYLFIPEDAGLRSEFDAWLSLPDVMPVHGAGYITARDDMVIDFDRERLIERIEKFKASRLDDVKILEVFGVAPKKGWDVRRARKDLRRVAVPDQVIATNYRPFDSRWLFFDSTLVWGRSWPTMQHVVERSGNVTMLATRMTKDQWDVWVARSASSHKAMSAYDTNSVFPLYLSDSTIGSQRSLHNTESANFSATFIGELARALGLPDGDEQMPKGMTAEAVFHYVYGVLRSSGYRGRYAEFLRRDYPRLPLPSDLAVFQALSQLGGELVALHLLESPRLNETFTGYEGPEDPVVGRVGWARETVWLDAPKTRARDGYRATQDGTVGFRRVPEKVWDFRIGGYQVCHKWLKDRKGRNLSANDLAHYQKIMVAISETIRLTGEIDEVIEEHGGWPGAFEAD